MVPIEMLSPGMRVKIVDEWNDGCRQNPSGLMDKYLGQIVTVLDTYGPRLIRIEEDAGDYGGQGGGHWCWNEYCFEYIVEDEIQGDFEASSKDEILSFIFGN